MNLKVGWEGKEMFKGKKELKRLNKILKGYAPGVDPIAATHSFVKELLESGAFHKERYERYRLLYKELKEREKNKYK